MMDKTSVLVRVPARISSCTQVSANVIHTASDRSCRSNLNVCGPHRAALVHENDGVRRPRAFVLQGANCDCVCSVHPFCDVNQRNIEAERGKWPRSNLSRAGLIRDENNAREGVLPAPLSFRVHGGLLLAVLHRRLQITLVDETLLASLPPMNGGEDLDDAHARCRLRGVHVWHARVVRYARSVVVGACLSEESWSSL